MTTSEALVLGSGEHTYTWIDNWATIPDTASGRENGRTHGIVYSAKTDRIVVYNQADPAVLVFTPDGRLEASWGDRFQGAHGCTLVQEGGEEYLWLTDQKSCEVVKTTLSGEVVQSIAKADHPIYSESNYSPTWVAQNPDNGDIWVGDGYGSYLVHRYTKDGTYLHSLAGSSDEEAGPLREPHGLNFVQTEDGPELFITDRANHRIQVFDGEGTFKRASSSCHSPCMFDFRDELVLVPELFTGIKLLDRSSLAVVAAIGDNADVRPRADGGWWPPEAPEGWPNLAQTDLVQPGRFNSPHGACFGPEGSIFVVEWIVGGRITKLQPVS